jgi:hypothetical protein
VAEHTLARRAEFVQQDGRSLAEPDESLNRDSTLR